MSQRSGFPAWTTTTMSRVEQVGLDSLVLTRGTSFSLDIWFLVLRHFQRDAAKERSAVLKALGLTCRALHAITLPLLFQKITLGWPIYAFREYGQLPLIFERLCFLDKFFCLNERGWEWAKVVDLNLLNSDHSTPCVYDDRNQLERCAFSILRKLKNVETLAVARTWMEKSCFEEICLKPSLKSLSVQRLVVAEPDEELNDRLYPNIAQLEFARISANPGGPRSFPSLSCFPALRSLKIHDEMTSPIYSIEQLNPPTFDQLVELELEEPTAEDNYLFVLFVRQCPNVEKLCVRRGYPYKRPNLIIPPLGDEVMPKLRDVTCSLLMARFLLPGRPIDRFERHRHDLWAHKSLRHNALPYLLQSTLPLLELVIHFPHRHAHDSLSDLSDAVVQLPELQHLSLETTTPRAELEVSSLKQLELY
jgi:hypothetical protein